jgi:hypothetical protein
LTLSACAQSVSSAPLAEEVVETIDGDRPRDIDLQGLSRDGRVLLVASHDERLTDVPVRRPGEWNDYLIERPDRRARPLCPGLDLGPRPQACALSDDGRYVVTCGRSIHRVDWRTCELWTLEAPDAELRPSTSDGEVSMIATPDGAGVYFVEPGSLHTLVYATFEDGARERYPIPYDLRHGLEAPDWMRVSRTGEYLIFGRVLFRRPTGTFVRLDGATYFSDDGRYAHDPPLRWQLPDGPLEEAAGVGLWLDDGRFVRDDCPEAADYADRLQPYEYWCLFSADGAARQPLRARLAPPLEAGSRSSWVSVAAESHELFFTAGAPSVWEVLLVIPLDDATPAEPGP